MDREYKEGETATFECLVHGTHRPHITWHFKNKTLNNYDQSKYIVSSPLSSLRSTLIILDVKSSDVGTYICNATNAAGSTISAGNLAVHCKQLLSSCIHTTQYLNTVLYIRDHSCLGLLPLKYHLKAC